MTKFFSLFLLLVFLAAGSSQLRAQGSLPQSHSSGVTVSSRWTPEAPASTSGVLWNQIDSLSSGLADASQQFPDYSNDIFETADDFVVPAGFQWSIDSIDCMGVFWNANPNNGPFTSFRVFIYNDSANHSTRPGAIVYADSLIIPISALSSANPIFKLHNLAVLAPGRYWISIVGVMPFSPSGQWGPNLRTQRGPSCVFRDRNNLLGSGAAWTIPTSAPYGIAFKLRGVQSSLLPNLCEDFTSATFPPTNWTTVYTGTLYWTRQTVSGYGVGTGSARFNAYSAASGTTQSLITMQFVPTVSNQAIIFDLAFRPYPATAPYRQDSLIILSSTDNGTTFTSLARYGPLTMATAPPSTGQFTPAASEWQKVTLLLPTNTNKISFVGYSDFGQDIFIDSTCVGPYVVGIANNNTGVPKTYSLSQNYPNPFNPTTDIKFALPKAGLVKMVVYDILGRIVETPVNEYKEAGSYTINFNAASLASGVYFYRVTANDFVDTKKMLLVK